MLSTSFGLGADQTLSWEVITANGKLVTASREETYDLYWAMSGGGPGTSGIAVSLTAKIHQANTVDGASFQFSSSNTASLDTYYAGVEAFYAYLPSLIDPV